MPKIPNWTRNNGVNVLRWNNDDDIRTRVTVTGTSTRHSDNYEVRLKVGDGREKRIRYGFDTKEDARKWAVRWMRNNPNPKDAERHMSHKTPSV